MNDKDKEAFDKWFIEKYRYNYNDLVIPESVKPQKEAWQAACEYKQKEIDELEESLATRLAKSYVAGKDLSKIIQKNLTNEVEKLQAENEKLRECVEEISKMRQEVSFYIEPTYPAILCIEVLKELEDK